MLEVTKVKLLIIIIFFCTLHHWKIHEVKISRSSLFCVLLYQEYVVSMFDFVYKKITFSSQHYSAVMKYISQGPMLLDVHMHRPHTTSRNFMDALLAFWPGLQVNEKHVFLAGMLVGLPYDFAKGSYLMVFYHLSSCRIRYIC